MAETAEELLDLALKSKEFGKKMEYCTKYLELNPKDRDVWDYKGDLFSALGKNEESIRCFEEKAKGASLNYQATGVFCGTEEAIKWFNAVLKEEPNSAGVWVGKGQTLIELKRFKDAIVCFDKALKIGSKINELAAWAGKARALLYLEKYEEALACFNEVLEILKMNPDNEIVNMAKNRKKSAEQRLKEQER